MLARRAAVRIAIGAVVLAALPMVQIARADVGCCMKRDSLRSAWVQVGLSFAQCENDNNREGDDIFVESGLVWWSIDC